ncbi:fluoride efflux transporter FluC [Isoptericola jiangsuensis]|uniref:fluoride efflux transporter FluC n=1 Tax=Isoptericola jiangsuensis TaxID=548579 RepID=UPI003AABD4D4
MPATRPPHRDVRLVALVAAGGAVGSCLRWAVGLALPHADGHWPWSTFTVNVIGAFLLGWLLEALARRGPETPRQRRVRLVAGTGTLGGFTTYSSLALDVTHLADGGTWVVASVYAGATLLLGTVAALLGVLLGSRTTPSTTGRLLHAADTADTDDDADVTDVGNRPGARDGADVVEPRSDGHGGDREGQG